MTTTPFSADSVKQYPGTASAAITGSMSILMKTNKYYTDGSLLSTGNSYTVTKAWGKVAVERGWASDTGAVLPEIPTPAGLSSVENFAVSQSLKNGKISTHFPSMGTRLPAGSLTVLTPGANAAFFDSTNQATIRLARPAYSVRLIFAGYAATAAINLKAAISAATDVTGAAANNSSGTWVNVTFSGASTGTIPVRTSATRPSLYFSDWMEIDGSSKIIVARALVPSAGNTEATFATFVNQTGSGAGSAAAAANWATETGDEWVNRRQSVDGIATPTSFTTTTTASGFSLVVGVQYLTTTGVVTVGGCGDSIVAGTYTTLAYNAHWVRALRALKVAGYGVECVNLGWSGQDTATYYLRALDAIQYLGLQHLIYSPWTPNDGADDPTQAIVAAMRSRWARVMLQADQYRVNVIPITCIPKASGNYATSVWTDAEDDLRRTLNAEIRTYPIYLDPDILVGNRPTTGTTASGFSDSTYAASGFVHLSEAGNEACESAMQAVLKGIVSV